MGMKARSRLPREAADMLPVSVEAINDEAEANGVEPVETFDSSDPEIEHNWHLQRVLGYVEGVADGTGHKIEDLLEQYAPTE